MQQVAEKAGITAIHYYVSKNQKIMGISMALKFSNAFEIDPNILNRVLVDFNLRKKNHKPTTMKVIKEEIKHEFIDFTEFS